MRIVIDLKAPLGQAIGIKEDLAMYLERWGDSRVVEITEDKPEQMKMEMKS